MDICVIHKPVPDGGVVLLDVFLCIRMQILQAHLSIYLVHALVNSHLELRLPAPCIVVKSVYDFINPFLAFRLQMVEWKQSCIIQLLQMSNFFPPSFLFPPHLLLLLSEQPPVDWLAGWNEHLSRNYSRGGAEARQVHLPRRHDVFLLCDCFCLCSRLLLLGLREGLLDKDPQLQIGAGLRVLQLQASLEAMVATKERSSLLTKESISIKRTLPHKYPFRLLFFCVRVMCLLIIHHCERQRLTAPEVFDDVCLSPDWAVRIEDNFRLPPCLGPAWDFTSDVRIHRAIEAKFPKLCSPADHDLHGDGSYIFHALHLLQDLGDAIRLFGCLLPRISCLAFLVGHCSRLPQAPPVPDRLLRWRCWVCRRGTGQLLR
mmetsp:Transcript_64753/g.115514  ORF Transcript_64753/g.115514 Transcript_64753/m.115514 type:complete len:373 (-) Transcript_64753:247-1365(-)